MKLSIIILHVRSIMIKDYGSTLKFDFKDFSYGNRLLFSSMLKRNELAYPFELHA